ncbi:MAG TPA: acyl-CoA dehydrogenase family protein [Candidatus Omnitrophota bacterium]|nr:acyl-CoA dehydrogenase family protein [Candidatus Omnitrophota bacterium]
MEFVKGSEEKKQALQTAEEAREQEWTHPSFLGELFAGNCRWDLIFPYPEPAGDDKKTGDEFLRRLESFLRENLDPDEADRLGEIPAKVLDGLKKLGCFGLKIPKEYGGLGLSQVNYNRAMSLVAGYCGSTATWLSAHQSIGVPQPLMLFGSDEQKKKYLPLFAKGAVSAFALTEPEVGSDPARMKTTATPIENGNAYLLNGEKLWCTNGPAADILVVMAQTPVTENGKEKKKITAFIVEKTMPGYEVAAQCKFMGLRAIQNGLIRFTDVRVPKENILWGFGKGLKLALITLNTGRLTLPAAVTGSAKWCLSVCRKWANERVQWGSPIGGHDAIAGKLAAMTATTFAMDSITWYVSLLADRKKADIRLEAAMSKLYCTEEAWNIIDDTMQIRGGRGYETADSLKGRGEKGIAVERAMRDLRINRILEGSSEIMRLFIAREAMDPHLSRLMPLLSPKVPPTKKIILAFKALLFYVLWYPRQWLPRNAFPKNLSLPPVLLPHLRFVGKASRRLARNLFHAMVRYGPGLEKKERVLFRMVDIGCELFAVTAACSRAAALYAKDPSDRTPLELAGYFSKKARRKIRRYFRGISKNSDRLDYKIGEKFLRGEFAWLEEGIISSEPEKSL